MNKLLTLPAIIAFSATTISQPVSAETGSDIAKNICEYVAVDDKKRLRSFLKMKKLKVRNLYAAVKCNGQDLLSFADLNSAVSTGELVIKKLPKKLINTMDTKFNTQALNEAYNKRINS